MNICVIGTGYVGLVAGTCLADMGNNVICVDNNSDKITQLNNGEIPIYEPGLEELIKNNKKENRLTFTTNITEAVKKSKVCFIAVATPQDENGNCNINMVMSVAKDIATAIDDYKVIVNKSTVPVGTLEMIKEEISKITDVDFDVVSNPEFLKQGAAVDDFLSPDRVIIGSDSDRAIKIMKEIYSPYFKVADRIIVMDIRSAEMTKYASNVFLAARISFINEIANLCECLNCDIEKVRIGISTDNRIGNKFLFPGLGYGGSCFPKDISALIETAKKYNISSDILQAVKSVNDNQKRIFLDKIINYYEGNIEGKTFAVWGLSFKPKTNDMREAPSVFVINELLKHGAKIKAYDPQAMENAVKIFGNNIEYSKSSYDALENADAMILLTEWNEFRHPDFIKIKNMLKDCVIFDGRNQYNSMKLADLGINYISVGRK